MVLHRRVVVVVVLVLVYYYSPDKFVWFQPDYWAQCEPYCVVGVVYWVVALSVVVVADVVVVL